MKKDTTKYLRNVRFAFPIFQKSEKRFYKDFKQNVYEYELSHSDVSMEELVNNFGSPKDVVVEYFNNMDSEKYLRLMRKSFYVKMICLLAAILIFIYFIIQTCSLYYIRKATMDSVITTEDVTIIYEYNQTGGSNETTQ